MTVTFKQFSQFLNASAHESSEEKVYELWDKIMQQRGEQAAERASRKELTTKQKSDRDRALSARERLELRKKEAEERREKLKNANQRNKDETEDE